MEARMLRWHAHSRTGSLLLGSQFHQGQPLDPDKASRASLPADSRYPMFDG